MTIREQKEIARLNSELEGAERATKLAVQVTRELIAELSKLRLRLKVYEDAEQAIIEHKLVTLPWAPHVGELIMTAVKALEMHRSTRLSRGEMTDEEREAFVGDAKP